MFKLSKQVETALMALKDMHESFEGVSISSIADKNRLSKNTLSKTLQNLMNQSLVTSVQGVNGGYKIAKPIEGVSFYELLLALNEIKPLTCTTDSGCLLEHQCSIKSPLQQWETRFQNFLKETTVKDLVSHTLKPTLTDKNSPLISRSLEA